MIISKRFTFEASHILPLHPGKCSRLHGHSWGLRVAVEGPVDPHTGMVMDYGGLKAVVEETIIQHLDHTHLGQYGAHCAPEGEMGTFAKPYFGYNFYPTSENLARRIFETLAPHVQKENPNVRLHEILVEETCTSGATYGAADAADDTAVTVLTTHASGSAAGGPCPYCGRGGTA